MREKEREDGKRERKREKADRDSPLVYALDAEARVRFQVGSWPGVRYTDSIIDHTVH